MEEDSSFNDFLQDINNVIYFENLGMSINIILDEQNKIKDIEQIKLCIEKQINKLYCDSMPLYSFLNAVSLIFNKKIGPVYYSDIEAFMEDKKFYIKKIKDDIVYLTPNYQFKNMVKRINREEIKYFILTDEEIFV